MTRQDQTGKLEFVSPRHDLNAPDLYIPSMAFATYCIINAALMGIRGKFRPELLGVTASTALIFIVIELIIIKASCYFMGVADQVHLLDFLAMIGYNFVGIIVSILVSLVAGKTGKYVCFLYTSIAMSFFIVRIMCFICCFVIVTLLAQFFPPRSRLGSARHDKPEETHQLAICRGGAANCFLILPSNLGRRPDWGAPSQQMGESLPRWSSSFPNKSIHQLSIYHRRSSTNNERRLQSCGDVN